MPTQILTKKAQKVQEALNKHGQTLTVLELSDRTHTAAEAAAALKCEVAQIVKSLVFQTQSGAPVLVLASGPNRVNEKTIEALIGEPIKKASADFTTEVTGFSIGGIPPLGHKTPIDLLFIDETLVGFDILWAAAGTPHAVFSLKGSELAALTGGKIVSIR